MIVYSVARRWFAMKATAEDRALTTALVEAFRRARRV